MLRCLELARKGAGRVAPNPMVGAVLVHRGNIIAEGWHRQYGGPHAEADCLQSVRPEHQALIPESTLYVNLEPCAHQGKTPPCADLIIRHRISQVVIGCVDTFSKVSGKGIEKLRAAGIAVELGIEEEACRSLNRRFFTFHEKQRPYVLLKWAQSADGFIAPEGEQRQMLSNAFSQRLVHKIRSEEAAILVGYKTALIDNPQLNSRLWPGASPLRIVVDKNLELPANLQLFTDGQPTLILNGRKEEKAAQVHWRKISSNNMAASILQVLHEECIMSVLIEGGSKTLSLFLDSGLWDEAFVIDAPGTLQRGLRAPGLKDAFLQEQFELDTDRVSVFYHA